jgi:nitric oxide reductase NorE protein
MLAAPSAAARQSSAAPGSNGLWTFLFIDMVVFLMMFVAYMGDRIGQAGLYAASQVHLHEFTGLVNTVILVTSSWMVVEAIRGARRHDSGRVRRSLGLAWLLGMAFVIVKIGEYHMKIDAGWTPATNAFFSFYFFITGVHLLHVLAGMVFIAHCGIRARAHVATSRYLTVLENTGLFWHVVDVLWLFIFPMLYLVGRVQ